MGGKGIHQEIFRHFVGKSEALWDIQFSQNSDSLGNFFLLEFAMGINVAVARNTAPHM